MRCCQPPPLLPLHALWVAHRASDASLDGGGGPSALYTQAPRFLCGGRLHFPHPASHGAPLLLGLAVVTAVYAALCAATPLHAGAAIAGLSLSTATWVCLLWVVLCDPGILPRHVTSLCASLAAQGLVLGGSHLLARRRQQQGMAKGPAAALAGEEEEEVRFCVHCRVWRPVGAHHCAQCGWCVQQLSHHCNVLGACIGLRTRGAFAALQALLPAGLLYMLGHAAAALALAPRGVGLLPAALTAASAAPALAGALMAVCSARVAGRAAMAHGQGRSCAVPASLVDFAAEAAPLQAAVERACEAAWLEVGSGGYAAPPEGSWEAACSEAMIECLGGTARLGVARAVAEVGVGVAPKGVVAGWDFLPL